MRRKILTERTTLVEVFSIQRRAQPGMAVPRKANKKLEKRIVGNGEKGEAESEADVI